MSSHRDLEPELITEQNDCPEPRKEQRGSEERGEREMDASGMQTQEHDSTPPPVVMTFPNQKNNRKDLLSTCKCHQLLLLMYRCSLEANLSPLMFRINANCNDIIDAFHSHVCTICSLSRSLSLVWESYLSS